MLRASQNLSLSFLLVERQTSIGKQFVSDVDSFLSGKEPDTYIELTIARDLWAAYCAGETANTDDFISGILK